MLQHNFQKSDLANPKLHKLGHPYQAVLEVSVNKINGEIKIALRATKDSYLGEEIDAAITLVPEDEPDC